MENSLNQLRQAVKNWWIFSLMGIALILLGVWVFRNPAGTLVGLATFFTIMLLFSSVASIFFAISNKDTLKGWGWNLAGGILELMVALALLRNPGLAAITMNFFLGFWVMFRATTMISISVEMRDHGIPNANWVLIGGILASLLAFCILINPVAGAVTIAVWAGLALITAGIGHIAISLLFRKANLKVTSFKDDIRSALD